ncbi:Periplasmic aromatic aldehyde oxidoreductase, molybdenum binding subunit YagR [Cystobacter fuscus DSM 2262]|uniref:Periplasmic aromatic aldehyde oxidoreductase, molybdenum binding subunit YagR n=1 Tax=Cystobacter fuscus (strain ATCC 25194 / DSM 2262 / NBRC 100088 / M29) TaxID=1242864 RepID=S9PD73_CYSF2|nr:xanthine dehydrogenase family protein molybdopterin-binding subunit [Cystobacter fuscus]EPX62335.1 Periplasmic aromatic aldehyde oxidoreductase, molybdenum binding subunit YagR [Cystobacter fuscus DSM 2262]
MTTVPFADRARVDAREKVMGRTAYAADVPLPGLLYAMTVPARIAKGQLTALSLEEAARVPGVVRILTADDFPPPPQGGGLPLPPTLIREIAYRGQPVALVVAKTLEAAIEGAEAVRATYADQTFSPLIDSTGAAHEPFAGVEVGNARLAMETASTSHADTYVSPAQHHNPIEMLSTTAQWSGGRLTVWEGTQSSGPVKTVLALMLRLDRSLIDVKSPSVGGSFGQKGAFQRQTTLVAHAAMLLGRPVKLVMPRAQIFHNACFRPRSRHHVKLGADAGKMVAVQYDADHQQSRTGDFPPFYHEATVQMYGIANYLGTASNIRIDTQAPGYMRTPFPQPSNFSFESAVDELAYKLGEDPVAFRLRHDATIDPLNGKPLSSRFLNDCIREGARRFGWERRTAAPGSMTLPDGTQVGWGIGCGAYKSMTTPSLVTLRVYADGRTCYAASGHEMGQGIRTAIAAVLLRELDLDPDRLEILIGDTSAAPQHPTAGSSGTASVVSAAATAAAKMREAADALFAGRVLSGNLHQRLFKVRRPYLEIEASQVGPGQDPSVLDALRQGGFGPWGPQYPSFTAFSYIAHFVEVHVEPRTRRVRVPRVVSVVDCGRVVSPRTAVSQVLGGVVWAIGATLREETEVDPRFGGWLNCDLADYVVPVNADVGDIDVSFIDKPDPLTNTIGAKGLGEVAMAGASGAIANAIYHATGKRVRKMPIRLEDLL